MNEKTLVDSNVTGINNKVSFIKDYLANPFYCALRGGIFFLLVIVLIRLSDGLFAIIEDFLGFSIIYLSLFGFMSLFIFNILEKIQDRKFESEN